MTVSLNTVPISNICLACRAQAAQQAAMAGGAATSPAPLHGHLQATGGVAPPARAEPAALFGGLVASKGLTSLRSATSAQAFYTSTRGVVSLHG